MKTHRPIALTLGLVVLCAAVAAVYVLRGRAVGCGLPHRERCDESHPTLSAKDAPSAFQPAEWDTYHGDAALRGVASGAYPDSLVLLWRLKAGAPVRQPPVIQGQRLFFATARGDVIAADFSGQRVWSKELFTGETQNGAPVREEVDAPVACFDGLVLVGASRGILYAFDVASGEEKWRADLDGPILGTPNFLPPAPGAVAGRVYVIRQSDAVLCCLDFQSGRILWQSEAIDRCDGPPSVSPDAVVFGSCAAALHVFSPDTGQLLRSIEIDQDSQVAGGVALDGDLAVSGSRSGKVLQVDVKAGTILWTNTDSKSEVFSTPAVTQQWVVASSDDGTVYGIEHRTGKTKWRFESQGTPSSAVIAGDKVVVSVDGELCLLRLADGVKLWSFKVSDAISSPAVTERLILVGSEDGTVVAFGPASEQGTVNP